MPPEIPHACAKQYDIWNQMLGEMKCYTDQGQYVPMHLLTVFTAQLGGLIEFCPDNVWNEDIARMVMSGTDAGEDFDQMMQTNVAAMMEFVRTGVGETDLTKEDWETISKYVSVVGDSMRLKASGEEFPSRMKGGVKRA